MFNQVSIGQFNPCDVRAATGAAVNRLVYNLSGVLFLVVRQGADLRVCSSLPLLVMLIILACLAAGYGALKVGWKTTWELLFGGRVPGGIV